MSETEAKVAGHYGSGDLTQRIVAALAEIGVPVERMSADALFPFDQLHGRQLAATKEHVARLRLASSMNVLDVGCGIGGPARYMAFTSGCRVTGIDLTEAFVVAARELTARCSMSDRVDFEVGNALAMPFKDARFEAAACQYVAMNIVDKSGLLREILRVLKPGGQLMFSAIVAGTGEPHYPLPWAREPAVSFLVSPDALRKLFEESGWQVLEWTDETHLFSGSAAPQPPTVQALRRVIMGDDFGERSRNLGQAVDSGALRSLLVIAKRPPTGA